MVLGRETNSGVGRCYKFNQIGRALDILLSQPVAANDFPAEPTVNVLSANSGNCGNAAGRGTCRYNTSSRKPRR